MHGFTQLTKMLEKPFLKKKKTKMLEQVYAPVLTIPCPYKQARHYGRFKRGRRY